MTELFIGELTLGKNYGKEAGKSVIFELDLMRKVSLKESGTCQ